MTGFLDGNLCFVFVFFFCAFGGFGVDWSGLYLCFSLLTLFECRGVTALDIDWLLTVSPGAGSLLIKSNFDSSFILGSTSCVEADALLTVTLGRKMMTSQSSLKLFCNTGMTPYNFHQFLLKQMSLFQKSISIYCVICCHRVRSDDSELLFRGNGYHCAIWLAPIHMEYLELSDCSQYH